MRALASGPRAAVGALQCWWVDSRSSDHLIGLLNKEPANMACSSRSGMRDSQEERREKVVGVRDSHEERREELICVLRNGW